MALKVYNTLSRKLETFKPIKKGKIGIYACGPTVYNFVHIGNLRAYIFYDLVRKYFLLKKFNVNFVSNITDIDDKSIRDSQKQGISLKKFTEKYTKAYLEDLKTLNIQLPDKAPKATDYIPQMIALTKKLLKNKHAYKSGKSYYYKIDTFKDYGKIARLDNLDQLKKNAEGRLHDADEYEKDDVRDFVLWKGYDKEDGDVFWETDLGKGRPGWHIECSVMSSDLLGDTFDMHLGGVDLIFPHHTNEIAQSEAASGAKFVNYWLHNEHLLVDEKKMSKSLNNFYTLRDLIKKGHDPKAIRYLLLATHYRQKLNFTFDGLEAAKNSVTKIQEFVRNISFSKNPKSVPKVKTISENAKKEFELKLEDDFNISSALAVVFDFMRDINKLTISKNDSKIVLETMYFFNEILGVIEKPKKETLTKNIKSLIDSREKARKDQDWDTADKIRDQLKEKGIILDDAPEGVRWKKV
tara:strand:+ start:5427 stop:6824 length:1398 start_codon:yes stop_codon:yes gene_type:complete